MKKLRISVCIPAFNEEANIRNLLRTILAQNITNALLVEILVILDGCTDKTAEKIREIRDKRIKLIEHTDRRGKSERLNEIFALAQGDVIVLFDADIVLDSPDTIVHLTEPFLHNKKLGLAGGNIHPVKAKTFIEKAITVTCDAYEPLRMIRKGKNPYSCSGRILALSKTFAQSVRIPAYMIGNDTFLYFTSITMGFNYAYQSQAKVSYRLPANLKDHMKQHTRFKAAIQMHQEIFGELVKKEYAVDSKKLFLLFLKQLIKHPFLSLSIFFINRYSRYKAKALNKNAGGTWSPSMSSKKGITHDK